MKTKNEIMTSEIITTLESLSFVGTATQKQFRHYYKAKNFGLENNLSSCMVTVFRKEDQTLVILQDVGHGTSVTNASEQIATEIMNLENLDFEKTAWVECYPYYGGDWDVDAIKYHFNRAADELTAPEWRPLRNEIIISFLRTFLKPLKFSQ